MTMPSTQQASMGVDRAITHWLQIRADYMWMRGSHQFRSIDANAPQSDGLRPDPFSGTVTQLESTGRRAVDRLSIGVNLRDSKRRVFGNVMYQLGWSRNSADSSLALPSDSRNPDADWGPAANDTRRRLMAMVTAPIMWGARATLSHQGSSAVPYTITTGRDDNRDTYSMTGPRTSDAMVCAARRRLART
jgi:hypothetical protein